MGIDLTPWLKHAGPPITRNEEEEEDYVDDDDDET